MKIITGLSISSLLIITQLCIGQNLKVGLLFDQFANERWSNDAKYLEAAFSEQGVSTTIKVAHSNLDTQIRLAQEFIDEGVGAIVMVAVDGQNSSEIVSIAKKNNVLLVAYDRPVLDSRVDLYISYNNLKVGVLQAKAMITGIKEGNLILINGPISDINAIKFKNGQMEVLKPYIESGKITIAADIVLDTWSEVDALVALYKLDQDFSQVNGLLAAVDWFVDAALEYAGDSSLFENIYATGQDPSQRTVVKLKKDIQNMTIFKSFEAQAKKTAEMTAFKLKNKKIKDLQQIPFDGYTINGYLFDPISVTKKNVDKYKSQFNE